MKYILIFLISFLFAAPALAAVKVEGSVPNVEPLQAAPAGMKPNVQHSVSASPTDGQNVSEAQSDNSNMTNSVASPDSVTDEDSSANATTTSEKTKSKFIWITLLILAIAGGFIFYKFYSNGKE